MVRPVRRTWVIEESLYLPGKGMGSELSEELREYVRTQESSMGASGFLRLGTICP